LTLETQYGLDSGEHGTLLLSTDSKKIFIYTKRAHFAPFFIFIIRNC